MVSDKIWSGSIKLKKEGGITMNIETLDFYGLDLKTPYWQTMSWLLSAKMC